MITEIYTSYFANIRNLPDDVIPIAICRFAPKGYSGLMYTKLAPTPAILNKYRKTRDENTYVQEYNEQVLHNFTPVEVLRDLKRMVPEGPQKIALICYEKPEDFCHRHLVAKWLKGIGVPVTEFKKEVEHVN